MPLWLIILLGAGLVYLVKQGQSQASSSQASLLPTGSVPASTTPSTFVIGQQVSIAANTPIFSDAALTQSAGDLASAGTMTVKDVPTNGISIGVVGPTGAGIGGGAPAYVAIAAVSPSGTLV